uniref:Uncharacterized protein n=1 Tax=Phlebotomus papatasi TaxID=29031 RepID=A0A1B0GQ69_PHLPP
MNIICPICTESVLPNEDLCANSCGHIFHYPCIRQWIERSKTCPQCRKLCSEKHLNRIYFTVSSAQSTEQDVVNLERKLEILNQNYQEKLKHFDELQEEAKKLRNEKKKSAKTIIAMEEKLNSKDFALKSSTNQLRKIKDELLEYQDAKKELDALKNQLEQVQAIEIMLTSNQTDVQELLGKHPSSETLAYMISNLKRDLVKSEASRRELRTILAKTKNSLKEETQLREQLQDQLGIMESEKFELQRQLRKRQRDEDGDEEDKNAEKRKSTDTSATISSPESPGQPDTDSPYLRIQSSAIGLTPILKKPNLDKPNLINLHPDFKKLTIFQKYRPEPQEKRNIPNGTYVSDGMGGVEKKENFPGFPSRNNGTLNFQSIKNRLKSGKLKNPAKH